MVALESLTAYLDELLQVANFRDYAPNGLQVAGRGEVRRLVTGVTACQALVEAAVAEGADALLVHHGYFWKSEPPQVVGMKHRRLKRLLQHDIALLAYHLPLDAHPRLGNNAELARLLGFVTEGTLNEEGIGNHGRLAEPLAPAELAARIETALGRQPLHIAAGEGPIQRVGWCSGAAQGMVERAAALGLDAFLSGEISEPTVHAARELGIHYYAAGHHATERYGVQALGAHLAERYGLEHRFVDIDNPV
mgnify:CR=1 FL=1